MGFFAMVLMVVRKLLTFKKPVASKSDACRGGEN